MLHKHQDLPRDYQIPGGVLVKKIVAGCGLFISISAVITAFIVPTTISKSQSGSYLMLLAACFAVILVLPFIFYRFYSVKNIQKQKR